MEFHPNDWLGRWQNFESYITSTDPYLQLAWQEAEAAAKLPMFKSGAKQFWQMACVTTSIGNPHTLGGWTITHADGGKLCIAWTDADGNTLGRAVYHLDHVLERGLEGKENALFAAEDVPADWPFRCLLAMEPMPPRAARLQGGLLSHLHFQYASGPEHLFDPDTHALRSPLWYATMCDGDGTLPIGQRVRHAVFGEGTVLDVDLNKGAHVIQFDGMGTPRSISLRAKLEKIGP
jgi:hypothetical protein